MDESEAEEAEEFDESVALAVACKVRQCDTSFSFLLIVLRKSSLFEQGKLMGSDDIEIGDEWRRQSCRKGEESQSHGEETVQWRGHHQHFNNTGHQPTVLKRCRGL